jgi:hypothetical protein
MDFVGLISNAFAAVKEFLGFGSKIQDEKNTPAELGQAQSDQKITQKGKINAADSKASSTGDDSDFSAGL